MDITVIDKIQQKTFFFEGKKERDRGSSKRLKRFIALIFTQLRSLHFASLSQLTTLITSLFLKKKTIHLTKY